MRSNSIIFLIILAVFIIAAAFVFPLGTQEGGFFGNRPIKLGLDLKGGVDLVYQADLTGIPQADQQGALQADAEAIRSRVDAFGVTEPVIQTQGTDRIRVQLPGISDVKEAKAVIGQTALLEFGEQVTDANDPAIKWKENTEKGVVGNWKPATGTVNGQTKELTSAYMNQNTFIQADQQGKIVLHFQFNNEGSQLSGQITQRLLNKPLGIFSAQGELLSYPTVRAQITDQGVIEGMNNQEARRLSALLNAGRLEVPLSPIYENTVSPVVGADFVSLAFKAAVIGILMVMLFMTIYYKFPGFLASLALMFYVLINLALFKLIPVTLSLAGLGGFILSAGMAVDANVLIFERMKEELRTGRTVGAAIEAGFKRAWSAIWDMNMTTFIACIIMFWLGSSIAASSIATGFAVTLLIGALVSMFTAITVTRTLLRLFVGTSVAQNPSLFTALGGAKR